MLTAQGKWLDTARRRHPIRTELAFAASAVLHAAAIALLLMRPGRELPPALQPVEVELVQQAAQTRGAPPPPQAAAPPEPQESAASAPAVASPTPPLPQAADLPAPSTPAPPAPVSPPQRPAPPRPPNTEVNLGNAARDIDPLIVTGDNVVPPAPDSRYRNVPPHYPLAAAKIGAEGTVQLVIHVAPSGQPLSVGIVTSSGNADLDAEARRAVRLWHFRPARAGSTAVPYDYVLNIHFSLGDR